ncbi:hypothetical protein B0T11DRAFT_270309 [Plectosphaerella cucumerina]|uniref:NAD(P)-binding domain-containing protein n=1 Tax=Plectosphaerella cucumerina TaxID=40658 RepID=A0A8K0X8I5_9PEZI|nr:hypothetical protein B0T11DRAFT_270309 [Plectosphaerella cucumerina]
MKLIVAGATGFVASEVIRQAVRMPEITSIIALARKPITADTPESSKIKNVVIKDYGEYPEEVKKELAGADACIWTVAVTPTRSRLLNAAEVKRVCHDYTAAGLHAMYDAGPAKPFRFLYMSGSNSQRDPAKKPWLLGDYSVMRGAVENLVHDFAAEHDAFEVCVAKPGIMSGAGVLGSAMNLILNSTGVVPAASVEIVSRAMLKQVVHGFEKEQLENSDLVRIGSK